MGLTRHRQRHAYLVIAHNNFYILEKLLLLLDGRGNDFYLHIDRKVDDFDFEYFAGLVKYSNVIYTERRINVRWGDFSQVEAELALFEEALGHEGEEEYDYLHVLSGVCLPIKTRQEIDRVFLENAGKEFVSIYKKEAETGRTRIQRWVGWGRIRVAAVWPFRGAKRDRNRVIRVAKALVNASFIVLQKAVRYDHLKKVGLPFGWGSNWVSITGRLAKHIVNEKELVRKAFVRSYAPDEHFIQTLILRSDEFRNRVYAGGNMRYVDWNRGHPYTFRNRDLKELMRSDKLFARKFDENVDREIVDRIYDLLQQKAMPRKWRR